MIERAAMLSRNLHSSLYIVVFVRQTENIYIYIYFSVSFYLALSLSLHLLRDTLREQIRQIHLFLESRSEED